MTEEKWEIEQQIVLGERKFKDPESQQRHFRQTTEYQIKQAQEANQKSYNQ